MPAAPRRKHTISDKQPQQGPLPHVHQIGTFTPTTLSPPPPVWLICWQGRRIEGGSEGVRKEVQHTGRAYWRTSVWWCQERSRRQLACMHKSSRSQPRHLPRRKQ